MLTRLSNLTTYIYFVLLKNNLKKLVSNSAQLSSTCLQLHNSVFPSFNLFMFTEDDDGTSINNEDRKKI